MIPVGEGNRQRGRYVRTGSCSRPKAVLQKQSKFYYGPLDNRYSALFDCRM